MQKVIGFDFASCSWEDEIGDEIPNEPTEQSEKEDTTGDDESTNVEDEMSKANSVLDDESSAHNPLEKEQIVLQKEGLLWRIKSHNRIQCWRRTITVLVS